MPAESNGPSARDPETSIYRRLDTELGCTLYRQAYGATRVGALITLIATAVLTQIYPLADVLGWAAAIGLSYGVRYVWLLRVLARPRSERYSRSRLWTLNALLFSTGVCWGTLPWLFGTEFHPLHSALLMFTLAGVMGTTPQNLSASPSSSRSFVFPLALGLISRLAYQGTQEAWMLAMTVLVFFVVTMLSGRELYLNLRHMVLLRLEKEQLVRSLTEAKERAEQSAAAKSQFLATMSHEIRTPMNGLLGMLEILRETELNNAQMNYVSTASRSAEALLELLNDVLDYTKMEVGRLELESIPFDWVAMLGEIAIINRVLATEKGIGFHLDIPVEGSAVVMGDPTRLRQILNNLLSNALKFTHEGNVNLRASCLEESGDIVLLRFSVTDSGIGIDREAQARLFQQFQQADASTTRKYGGSGLGLSISQRLARLMGGEITFSSEAGKGSEFSLTVPLRKAPADAPRPEAGFVHVDGHKTPLRIRVLLVEDDAVSQRVAVLILKSFGLTPTVVDNGKAAVQAATEENYDIVFMDCQMPEMDGFAAAREIRRRLADHSPTRPVIIGLSAKTRSEDREEALNAGMDDYLTKPVRKREMRLCLERWIEREHLERQVSP